MTATPIVQEFFDQYARSRSVMDSDRIASQYADSCMFAGPDGARVGEKQAVLVGFPKALELLKAVGYGTTTLASLDETRLDEHYVMARARFVWHFEKESGPPIDVGVDSTFIVHGKGDVLKIVFQQEREDFWQVLRNRGVMPAQG